MRRERAAAYMLGISVWACSAGVVWAFAHTYLLPLAQAVR